MVVTCLYLCNASNLVIKNKQETEEHDCVLIVDNKHFPELVFICHFCLKNIREHLAGKYYFHEPKKCFMKTFLRKEDEAEFQATYYRLNS